MGASKGPARSNDARALSNSGDNVAGEDCEAQKLNGEV